MAGKIQSPEKELRFTRSGQAAMFWIVAAVAFAVAMTLLLTSIYRDVNPEVPHPVWAVLPLIISWLCVRLALRMTKHAYLILTPMGIEIFPLFKAESSMQMVMWSEIDGAETDASLTRLTLHHNAEKTSGIHLSLRPIRKDRRALLAKAISGRVSRA